MNLEKDLERVKELLKDVKYLTFEQISNFLDWTEQDKKDYKVILMSWVDSGDLILSKKNRFSLPENLGYVKGIFRIIKNRFAFVDREDSVEKEGIFIPKEEFNNALDGDTVLTEESKDLSDLYKQRANNIRNFYFCGRLADFEYYNIDQTLKRALEVCKQLKI